MFVTHQKHKLISKSCFRWQKQGWYIGIKTTLFPFWLGFDSQIWLPMWVKFCVVFALQGFLSAFSCSSLSSSQTESCSCCISFPICLLVYYFCFHFVFVWKFYLGFFLSYLNIKLLLYLYSNLQGAPLYLKVKKYWIIVGPVLNHTNCK